MKNVIRLCSLAVTLAGAGACTLGTSPGELANTDLVVVRSVADSARFTAGSVVPVKLTVTFGGAALAGSTVAWSVTGGGGTVAPLSTTTDTLGVTQASWLLGDTTGVNTLVITLGSHVDTLHVIGTVGVPSYLVAVGSDAVTTSVGVPVTLQAKVTDRAGNPVTGTTVNWTKSGGTLSASSVVTTTGGLATVTFSAAARGTYSAVAELPGLATRTFQVVVQ